VGDPPDDTPYASAILPAVTTPRIVGVAPGDPFAVDTFSGISVGLLGALRDRGALVGAVDGSPRWLNRVEQAASFHPDRLRWRQRFFGGISPVGGVVREARSAVARRRAEAVARRHDADAMLQLTGWYRPAVPGVLRCSYHDGNLASYLARPDLDLGDGGTVRRLLAWERRLYDETDVIFTMSEWLRESFLDAFGQAPEKVVAVGAGTDLTLPERTDRDWERPRFLFVGREFERKGGLELLRAWPIVRAARPDAELTIVGPGSLSEELPDGVRFAGHIDRSTPEGRASFEATYAQATAFALPSLYEPFGIVFLEAMAHGLPCVAADRCAMPEIVEDGVTGRVADPTDPDALAEALLAVTDPDVARRMGEAGRERLVERFTWAAVGQRVLDAMSARLST
jgi:glycosyltransferase involved in cell wall biosynthesis